MKLMFIFTFFLVIITMSSAHAAYETISISHDGRVATVLIDSLRTDEVADKFAKDIQAMPKSVKVLKFYKNNFGGRTPQAWKIAKILRNRRITTFADNIR